MRIPRHAARIAVLDPDRAVFLFRYDNEEVGVHWAMPGGGLEPGETPREGAQRELREETGWSDLEPGPLLCTWEHDFTRAGIPVRQHEHIYLVRGPHREPTGDLAAAHAEDKILHWRWWTPRELAVLADPSGRPNSPPYSRACTARTAQPRRRSTSATSPTQNLSQADDSRHDEAAQLSRPSQRLKNKLSFPGESRPQGPPRNRGVSNLYWRAGTTSPGQTGRTGRPDITTLPLITSAGK